MGPSAEKLSRAPNTNSETILYPNKMFENLSTQPSGRNRATSQENAGAAGTAGVFLARLRPSEVFPGRLAANLNALAKNFKNPFWLV